MIPLFIQLTFTKYLPLYFIYLFRHIICFLISLIPKKYVKNEKNQIQHLQIKNKEVYKILLESQVKEKSIAYTKWDKCLKKERMHNIHLE
jgi:hypothetical protein